MHNLYKVAKVEIINLNMKIWISIIIRVANKNKKGLKYSTYKNLLSKKKKLKSKKQKINNFKISIKNNILIKRINNIIKIINLNIIIISWNNLNHIIKTISNNNSNNKNKNHKINNNFIIKEKFSTIQIPQMRKMFK